MTETKDLVPVDNYPSITRQALPIEEIAGQVRLVKQVMRDLMKEDVHYGVIPGTSKPTLYQAGAQLLNVAFRLQPQYEIVGKELTPDRIYYQVKCTLIHIPSGQTWAEGMGACNSWERKYRYRAVAEKKLQEGDKERSVGVETRGGKYGSYKVYLIPVDPFDLDNTLLKMACKRALVAANINATASSDLFTQDIEDMPKEYFGQDADQNGQGFQAMTQAQRRKIMAIKNEKGLTDEQIKALIKDRYGVESSKNMTVDEGSDLIDYIETFPSAPATADIPIKPEPTAEGPDPGADTSPAEGPAPPTDGGLFEGDAWTFSDKFERSLVAAGESALKNAYSLARDEGTKDQKGADAFERSARKQWEGFVQRLREM